MESIFGTGKTAYGLGRITMRLQVTTCCVIGVALLPFQVAEANLALFFLLVVAAFSTRLRSKA